MRLSFSLGRRPAVLGFALAFVWLCQPETIVAQSVTWLGGSNTSWGTTANWSSSAIPGSANTVVYSSTSANLVGQVLGATRSINGIVVGTVSGSITVTSTNANQQIGIGGGGIDMSAATGDLSLQYVNFSGNSTINVASGRLLTLNEANNNTLTGTQTFNGAGTTRFSGGSPSLNGNIVVSSGLVDFASTVYTSNGSFLINGGTVAYSAGGRWTMGKNSTATMTLSSGAFNGTGAGQFDVNNDSVLNVSGGTFTYASSFNVGYGTNGSVNVSGGSFTSNGTVYLGITPNANGTFTTTGGTTTFAALAMATNASSGTNVVGRLVVNGGQVAVSNFSQMAAAPQGNASIVLSAGTFTMNTSMPTTRGTGATSTVTLDGGVLRSGTESLTLLQSLTTASITNNGAFVDSNGFSTTIAQTLVDGTAVGTAGSLTKLGSGTLTLSASNSYSGNTRINTGALNLGNANALAASTLDMNSGDGGSLVFGLTGTNTYSIGGLIGSRNIVTSGSVVMSVGANATSGTYSGVLSGGGAFTKVGAGMLTLSSVNTYTGTTTIAAGALQIGNGGSAGALSTSSVITGSAGGSLIFNRSDNVSQGSQFANGITGGIGLSKIASGALTLSSSNSYTGGTVLSAGQLNINHPNAIGTGTFTISGGAIDNTSAAAITLTTNNPQAWNADFTFVGTKDLDLGSGSVTLSADRQVTTTAGTLTVAGPIGGSSGLRKAGGGTLTLSGSNTYSGATQVTAGLLRVDAANAISSSSAITLGGSTTRGFLEIDAPLTISSLTFTGSGGDVVDTSQSTATFSATSGTATITVESGSNVFHAAATLASPTRLDVSSGAIFTFHNNISGSATFTKQGLGTLNIVGDNDGYSGSFLITGGRVNIGSGMNQIGTGTTTLSGGATLDLGGQAFTDRVVVLSGTILNAGGTATTTTISGPATISGSTVGTYNITSAGIGTFQAAVGNGSLPVNVNVSSTSAPGGQAIFSDLIAGQGNVTVYGGGTATFNGAVSGFTVTHGVSTFNAAYNTEAQVQNGGSATFAGTTGASSMIKVFAGGAGTFSNSVTGTVQVWGAAEFTSASSLTGSLTTNSGGQATFSDMAVTVASGIHNDGQLTVNRTTGSQTISGVIDGIGSLVKQGAGSLLLSGNNSYSGGTWIDGGTLTAGHVNAFGSGVITLGSGATLDLANYLVTNAITNNGGTIRGGTLTGTVSGTSNISGGQTTFDSTIAGGARIDVASSGTASFGNGATIQTGATIANNGVIRVNRSVGGPLGFGSAVSGAGRFQVEGGVASLGAANTYTGNTVITGSGSVLKLGAAGSFANSPVIVVGDATSANAILDLTAKSGTFTFSSDQTLKGGGTIQLAANGVLDVQGTFAPGNSPGLFTYDGGTTLLSGTTIIEILGTNRATLASHGTDPYYDAVNVINGGTLTFGGLLTLDITGTYADNTIFNLFTASGTGSALTGNFSSMGFAPSSIYSSLTFTSGTANPKIWTSSTTTAGQTFTFDAAVGTLVVVPEPGTIIFAGIGIAMAGWSLWKRRRTA